MLFLVACFPMANTSKNIITWGPKLDASHWQITRRLSRRDQPNHSLKGFRQNCNSLPTITSEIKYDIWCGIFDMWHVIFDMRCRFYRIYDDVNFYYFTHALKYPIPVSARTLASMPYALGDGESLTFAESMGGLTTNPIFACKDLVNQIVVFDSKNT